MKVFLRLPILYAVLAGSPLRDWPRLLWCWLHDAPSADAIIGFAERFRERHWSATPDVAQQVCAYVALTTRDWPRFTLGLYVGYGPRPILRAIVPPDDRNELSAAIRAALAPVLPHTSLVSVGLTPLNPESE